MAFKLGAQKCLPLSRGHKEGTRCRSFNIPVFPAGVSSEGPFPGIPGGLHTSPGVLERPRVREQEGR